MGSQQSHLTQVDFLLELLHLRLQLLHAPAQPTALLIGHTP